MSSQPALAIEATGLVKAFGETRAVDGVDLAVPRGAVYGVLGPNGAGKTTTIRMLATLLRPDAGSAHVLGRDVVADADAVRSLVSLTGQLASVDDDLTGRENLVLLARLLGYRGRVAKGTTVLLCTQYLDEADQLADRIAVIDHGRVIAEGTPGQLKASTGQGALHVCLALSSARRRRGCCKTDSMSSRVSRRTLPRCRSQPRPRTRPTPWAI